MKQSAMEFKTYCKPAVRVLSLTMRSTVLQGSYDPGKASGTWSEGDSNVNNYDNELL